MRDRILHLLRRSPRIGLTPGIVALAFKISKEEAIVALREIVAAGDANGNPAFRIYAIEGTEEVRDDPLTAIGWILGKSAIAGAGYSPSLKVVEVVFRSAGSYYRYSQVKHEDAVAFMAALRTPHQMKAFEDHIKPYTYRRFKK